MCCEYVLEQCANVSVSVSNVSFTDMEPCSNY
jgi:hypothetical protein